MSIKAIHCISEVSTLVTLQVVGGLLDILCVHLHDIVIKQGQTTEEGEAAGTAQHTA